MKYIEIGRLEPKTSRIPREMSQNNLIHAWEHQFENNQVLPRSIPDEVIGIYELYVKEEGENQDGKSDTSGSPDATDHQLLNGDIVDLEAAIDADVMNEDGSITKLFGKDLNLPVLTRIKESEIPYSQTLPEGSSNSTPRMIDKDDPRSRLHFVKYLKRDGKTLKIWECGICSKEFRHQYTLMRHLPTHTDERNFKCEACGKAFRQLSTLSQHKAIHSDARPYVCDFCKKTFNRVSTLISHRKTHSENKPHKCPVCGKGFHQKGNLRNHVFTHTNERPYKCESCGKGFNQMSNLVCHKVKAHAHTEKMQYSCGKCGKDFPRRFALRSHEEEKHGIKYRTPTTSSSSSSNTTKSKKKLKIVELADDDSIDLEDKENITPECLESFLVDKIETKAMENALLEGQQPFALFKPANGIPVLVKVTPAGPNKHMLNPATAEDLRMTEKNRPLHRDDDDDNNRGAQLKVPVVATVKQTIDADGKFSFVVEPSNPDQDEIENLLTPLDSEFFNQDSLGESERHSEPGHNSSVDDCNELLELAAQGGIQFVRATEDGRYEVMSNLEARDLMAQNSHDVTILEGADAEAISVAGTSDDVIISEADNQIMVLDSGRNQKPDEIEMLENKDIRILESRNIDERFVDNFTFLQQSKIDDLILGGKSAAGSFESGMPITNDEDFVTSHQDLSSILGHSSDMTNFSMNSSACIPPLLTKNDASSLLVLNDPMSYLKNGRNFSDDFSSLFNVDGNSMDENSVGIYDTRVKMNDFDDMVTDHGLMPMNQDFRLLGRCQTPIPMPLPSFSDMKILGPKYQEFEAASQNHDIKIFGGYDQFLRGTGVQANGYRPFDANEANFSVKDLKVLDDKIEEDCLVKSENEKPNLVAPLSKTNPNFPDIDETRHSDKAFSDMVLLQANGLSDYLNFERSDSPGSQKRSFSLDGLPDLN